jgi:hypothetical protein
MVWYVFDMTGFPEPIHLSLARSFTRALAREGAERKSRLYKLTAEQEGMPLAYYLCAADERGFARLIRQFGGRRSSPPPSGQLQEIKIEGEPKVSVSEADTAPC